MSPVVAEAAGAVERRLRALEVVQAAAPRLLTTADPDAAEQAIAATLAAALGVPRAHLTRAEGAGSGHAPTAVASFIDERGDLVVPLASGGGVLASVVVPRPARGFGPEDLWIADGVAAIAGPALAGADRASELEETVRSLREVEHAKSEFLNLASHELRGPLTVLMGYLSLLEEGAFGAVPEALASSMPMINARMAEMETLINAMLDTARLDGDQLRLDLTSVDLREIVDDAVRRCEVYVQPGQHLGLRCPDHPVIVRVDRDRMLTVVANIVSNAIKYSVENTDVTCSLHVEGETATISVRDTGIGIAAEDIETLFTRFGRVRTNPQVRTIPGTGLGLYLARELTRALGGDVFVDSQVGVGSTFTVMLPLAD